MLEHPYGPLSLVPPVAAIVLAITTRRVVLSLLAGIFSWGTDSLRRQSHVRGRRFARRAHLANRNRRDEPAHLYVHALDGGHDWCDFEGRAACAG